MDSDWCTLRIVHWLCMYVIKVKWSFMNRAFDDDKSNVFGLLLDLTSSCLKLCKVLG
jgi:hypothetical protein